MKLSSISVNHFKSLLEVNVQLHPRITVLVGPNAVGKSNFVDALRFLRDVAKGGLEDAVARRDGMARIRPHGADHRAVMVLDAETVDDDGAESTEINHFEIKTPGTPHETALLTTEKIFSGGLSDDAKNWRFSAPDVNALRTLSTQDTDEPLREDGSNWASVIRSARRSPRGRGMLDRITEMMQVVLPEFQDVKVLKAGSYLVPHFQFGNQDGRTRSFDPVELSDGTLRIFGILLSLYQRPPPPLLVIEEPEIYVHPGVLAMLAEAFQEVSETTQLIITTHSPQLVEHFAPEHIRIVTMTAGVTHISPIKETQRKAVQQGLMSLGEFMAAEGLQPEAP